MLFWWIILALVILAYFSVIFVVGHLRKDNSLLDIAWGPGFVLVVAYWMLWRSWMVLPTTISVMVINSMVVIWALRLAAHIFMRHKKVGEDERYASFRKKWKTFFGFRSFVAFYLPQAFALFLISWPLSLHHRLAWPEWQWLSCVGLLIWATGLLIEAIADIQLRQFKTKKQNHGKVLSSGIWKFSRHPNYFGESLLWWGVALVAVASGASLWAFLGPVTITFSLLRVSGVTLLEQRYKGNTEYDKYKRNTSAFIPWFPRKSK